MTVASVHDAVTVMTWALDIVVALEDMVVVTLMLDQLALVHFDMGWL